MLNILLRNCAKYVLLIGIYKFQCGGNNVLILNEVVDPRSRHSSAGSTHADLSRSAPMSPHCVTTGVKDVMIDNVNAVTAVHGYTNGGGGGDLKHRHRHASAGSMNYQVWTLSPFIQPFEYLTALRCS